MSYFTENGGSRWRTTINSQHSVHPRPDQVSRSQPSRRVRRAWHTVSTHRAAAAAYTERASTSRADANRTSKELECMASAKISGCLATATGALPASSANTTDDVASGSLARACVAGRVWWEFSLASLGNPLVTFASTPNPVDGSGTGVFGSSGSGTGVLGTSHTGRGGVFQSIGDEGEPVVAQMRLVPADYDCARRGFSKSGDGRSSKCERIAACGPE